MKAIGLAILSGVLLTLSFPPFDLWPLAWIALTPLYRAALDARDARTAANLGAVAGLVFYGTSLHWLVRIFGPLAAAFWCVFALFLALHCALWWRFWRLEGILGLAGVLLTGLLWAGAEYFRSEIWWLNCSWLSLGYSQTPNLPILQSLGVWGLYGLSALLASANAAWSLLGRRGRPALALAAIVLCVWAWGKLRLSLLKADEGRAVKVALVQDESFNLDRLAGFSLAAGARDAGLLVWPEYAFVVQPAQADAFERLLGSRLRGSRAVAVVGGAMFPEDMNRDRQQNFAWVLSPEGRLAGRYDKLHPIPFVEKNLPPNPAPHPVQTSLGSLGIQICYDLDFSDGARKLAREGAEILVVPNADPMEWGLWQHRQHSAMSPARAVEAGLWIARAASSGYSQIIDPAGRIRASLEAGKSGTLVGEARMKRAGTPYTRWGWLFAPLSLAATAAALLVCVPRLRR